MILLKHEGPVSCCCLHISAAKEGSEAQPRVFGIIIDQLIRRGATRETDGVPPHPTGRRPPLLNRGRAIRTGPETVDLTME